MPKKTKGKKSAKKKAGKVLIIKAKDKPRKMKIEKPDGSTVTVKNGLKKTVKIKRKAKKGGY